MDPEIVSFCCNYVEQLIKKNKEDKEINKLNLVTTILIQAWDLKTEQDMDVIIKSIKFCVNNNQVKKIKKSKIYKKYIKDWIIKKLSWMPFNYVDIYLSPLPNMPSTQLLMLIVNKLHFPNHIAILIVCFLAIG